MQIMSSPNLINDRLSKLSPVKRALLEDLKKKRLRGAMQGGPLGLSSIPRASRVKDPPLSFAQQRMWVLHQFEPGSAAYSDHVAVRLKGRLDIAALEESLTEVVCRHETLRTTFPVVDGNPVQRIAPPLSVKLPVTSLLDLPKDQREERLQQVAAQVLATPFHLERGPLMRTHLIRIAEDEYVLVIVLQHIIFDGWSRGVLIRELSTLYAAFLDGRSSPLPELPIQYADFACWQREWLTGERLETQMTFWRKQLNGELPVLDLAIDGPRPAVQTFRGANQTRPISAETKGLLEQLSRSRQSTLYMTLLAIFMTLLHRYTGQQDIIVGTPTAGRGRTETDSLIGVFLNTLALRLELRASLTFEELLARVRDSVLQAQAHQDVPFEMVVEAVMPRRDPSRTPLFQVMFERSIPIPAVRLPGLDLSPIALHNGASQFDLTLVMIDSPGESLVASVDYNVDLFDHDRISRLLAHFEVLLVGVAAEPSGQLAYFPLLPEAERKQVLVDWNSAHVELPSSECFPELFAAQVRKAPQAVAVALGPQELTYAELNRRSNQLAHYLRERGIRHEAKVAVCLQRSPEMLITFLAAIKAGGAYLPLDPEYPPDRMEYVLQDAAAPVLLTSASIADRLTGLPRNAIRIDEEWEAISRQPHEAPAVSLSPSSLAYVIYTSGSTGRPKGVLVEHGGMTNHLWAKVLDLTLSGNDVIAQTASCAFDISIWQFLAGLLVGAKVQILPDEITHDGWRLLEEVERLGISIIETVPALLGIMLEHANTARAGLILPRLRWMISTGEALPVSLCQSWFRRFPRVPLLNAYGPTECSDDISHCVVAPPHLERLKYAPIGRPIGNTQAYVLDEFLQPQPVGIAGELYVGGDGVGRGYVNRPELTAERFLPDGFRPEGMRRLYRTGDRVRWLADGNLEFMERVDHQVKIRGFRIELGEIEARLLEFPGVTQAAVLARDDGPGEKRLVAYFAAARHPAQGGDEPLAVSAKTLRAYLTANLPDYMVPAAYVALENMPLTTSGKVDRKSLPAPTADAYITHEYVPPEGETETALAVIWADVLKVERIGRHDNFFEMGGSSLSIVTLIERLRSASLYVDVRAVFAAPTIAELAQELSRKMRAVEVPLNLIPRRDAPQADASKAVVVRI